MTQEIIYCAPSGIVVASDSLVIHVQEDGSRRRLAARKLFPLGEHSLLGTAGAFVGVRISHTFANQVWRQEWTHLEQLWPPAQHFFEERYQHFIEQNQAWFDNHPDAHRSLYILLAGRTQRDTLAQWQAIFLSSEDLELPLRVQRIGEILTIPRRLGVEGQLMSRMKQAASLQDVAAFCHHALETLAERDSEQVGGPFHVAVLDRSGLRWWQPQDGREGR